MSGVPVKIAENYKPPKKLALTQSVSQRLSTGSSATTQVLERSTYDFGLEQTVQAKMNEWQRVRQRETSDRKERLRLHQQERQSVLDAKQKQMLTAVSYPSTDELSSDDDGDDSGHGTSSDASKSAVNTANMKEQKRAQLQHQQQQQFSPSSCFNNILVPTVMPGQEKGQPFPSTIGGPMKSPHYSKFNFHEFENDTSSPFDNVELKTINDLDILAEVWNTSVAINNADSSSKDNTPTGDDDSNSTTNTANGKTNKPVQLPNQSYGNQQSIHSSPFPGGAANMQSVQSNHMPMNHSDAAAAAVSPISIANHFYGNQMHYNHQTDPNQSYHTMATQPTYMNTTPLNNNPSYVIGQQYVPNRYTTVSPTYDNQVAAAAMALPNHNNGIIAGAATTANAATTNSMYGDKTVITTNFVQAKSKWKSVPDIMQEINTELRNSEGRRGRNTSECKMNLNAHSFAQ